MKRLVLHLLIATLTFTFGLGTDRILNSKAPKAPMPEPQKVETFTPQVITTPTVPVIPVTVAPPETPQRLVVFDYNTAKFEPEGVYYIVGRKPKAFREIESIDLWSQQGVDEPLSGGIDIEVNRNNTYELHYATFSYVTENRLFFVTSFGSDEYIEYRFDGEFISANPFSLAGKSTPVVRGTLTKTRNGRRVAETVVSLRLEEHLGC